MAQTKIPESWRTILGALAAAPAAWQAPEEIAKRLNWDSDKTIDLLAELDVEGWVDVWERPDGVVVTLSPWGAARLRLQLAEFGQRYEPRWVSESEPALAGPRARRPAATTEAWEWRSDKYPLPDECAVLGERADQYSARPFAIPRNRDFPRPTVLVGLSTIPWPGPGSNIGRTCPVCGGRPLTPSSYCLYCDRWGLDSAVKSRRKQGASAQAREAGKSCERSVSDVAFERARQRRKLRIKARIEREKSARDRPSKRGRKTVVPRAAVISSQRSPTP